MNRFYVYLYLNPAKPDHYCYENNSYLFKPIYIGKGKNRRYLDHLRNIEKHTNYDFKHVLKEILNEGFTKQDIENHILIIYCNSEQEAFDLEIRLIKEIGRKNLSLGPLVNWTDGGEGMSVWSEQSKEKIRGSKNPSKRPEIRKKLSESHLGKKRKPFSKEQLINLRKSRTRRPVGMLGKHHSIESKNKISQSMKNKKLLKVN